MANTCNGVETPSQNWHEKLARFGIVTVQIGRGTTYEVDYFQLIRIQRAKLELVHLEHFEPNCALVNNELLQAECEKTVESTTRIIKELKKTIGLKRHKRTPAIPLMTIGKWLAQIGIAAAGGYVGTRLGEEPKTETEHLEKMVQKHLKTSLIITEYATTIELKARAVEEKIEIVKEMYKKMEQNNEFNANT